MTERARFDIVVVGAGPAGIASACAAAESHAQVCVVDDNPAAGGQIWRGGPAKPASIQAAKWFDRLRQSGVQVLAGTSVMDQPEPGTLLTSRGGDACELCYSKLILATGARERFLPFPGWTLPNVMGAGGMEAMVRGGLSVAGRRIVIAGTGPLLPAVAAELREHGAVIPLIAEQAPRNKVMRFGLRLAGEPGKLAQAARLRWSLRGTRYAASAWPVRAEGDGQVRAVVLESGGKTWREECDYLAVGFGLVPNLELAALIGCETEKSFVAVNEWQETSVSGVYCAGEPTGIGGVDLALAGGQIAGHAAAGQAELAKRFFPARARAVRFQHVLEETFALREELRRITTPEALVCRCEDVPFSRLAKQQSWRAAKIETRCGMGPCQGRVCGPAVEFLMGWKTESVRPPIFPATVQQVCGSQTGET